MIQSKIVHLQDLDTMKLLVHGRIGRPGLTVGICRMTKLRYKQGDIQLFVSICYQSGYYWLVFSIWAVF